MATAGLPEWSPEKAQIDQLLLELQHAFGAGSEDVRIAVNTDASGEQVDGVLVKDGLVFVLEFKSWSGRIAASMTSKNWRIRTPSGRTKMVPNPAPQALRKRESIGKVLRKVGVPTDLSEPDGLPWPPVWIVVNSTAKATLTGFGEEEAWLDIVPISEVAGRLRRTHVTRPPVPQELWNVLLDALKATPCEWTAWLERRPRGESSRLPSRNGEVRVPKIDEWLFGRDTAKVRLALATAELLELRSYLPEVLASLSHEDPGVQATALHVLYAWQPPGFHARLAEMAEHSNPNLGHAVLEFLATEPCPEAVNALHRVVMRGPVEDSILALRALGTTGNAAAGRVLVKLLRNRIATVGEPGPFPLATLVAEAGRARARGCAPHLAELLRWIASQGRHAPSEVLDLRETAITALGMSGDHAFTEVLLALLAEPGVDPVIALEALGLMGDPVAGPAIQKYLDSPDKSTALEAMRALGRIRDPRAFDRLFRWWIRILGSDEAAERRLEDALVSIDPRRLERELPPVVQARLRDKDLYRLLWAWGRVVTTESRSALIRLLEAPEVCWDAASFLARIPAPGAARRASELLASGSGQVRAAALWLLSRELAPQELTAMLLGLERDPEPAVRVAVVGLYAQLPPEEARARVLPLARDSEEEVRHYALVILGHTALLAQFHARWATDSSDGAGEVLLLPEALVCGGSATPEVIPLETVSRVAIAQGIGPGGALFVTLRDGGESRKVLVMLEGDPLGLDRKPWLDPWYDSLTSAIFQVRGKRVDLGPRGLRPSERSLTNALMARLDAQPHDATDPDELEPK